MLYGALLMSLYPFFYAPAKPVAAAMALFYTAYVLFLYRHERKTYEMLILLFAALAPLPLPEPYGYAANLLLVLFLYFVLRSSEIKLKYLIAVFIFFLLVFLGFSDATQLIFSRIQGYTLRGTEHAGLHFYKVIQTIREAGKIPFETFANRIAGSEIGLLLSVLGYILLVVRRPIFLLALPLAAVGTFAYWGGLRFTVYAVPVAALGSVYLFWEIGEFFRNKQAQYLFAALATLGMLYPNIQHVIGYRVPTVFNKSEVTDLAKLNKISGSKDYTLAWWDYAYPITFYSDTQTLIDGGKHNNDNFIISKILQTDSPKLAASLARLSVETYAASIDSYQKYLASGNKWDSVPSKFKFTDPKGKIYHSNEGPVANVLFRDKQSDQKDPNLFLDQLKEGLIPLPKKTRDIYLYLPYRMIGIFPTVMVFGNIDLTTGKKKRNIIFLPGAITRNQGGIVGLSNGVILDLKKGMVQLGRQRLPLREMIITENGYDNKIKLQKQVYHFDGSLVAVFLKSYGKMIIMDTKTFESMYVQMFMLGRYDKRYFEPVVTSPYTRIYRLKI